MDYKEAVEKCGACSVISNTLMRLATLRASAEHYEKLVNESSCKSFQDRCKEMAIIKGKKADSLEEEYNNLIKTL